VITTKTGIIGVLRNYYGKLKDKIYELEGTENPHHIPFSHQPRIINDEYFLQVKES